MDEITYLCPDVIKFMLVKGSPGILISIRATALELPLFHTMICTDLQLPWPVFADDVHLHHLHIWCLRLVYFFGLIFISFYFLCDSLRLCLKTTLYNDKHTPNSLESAHYFSSFPTVRSSLKGAADKAIKALQEVINKQKQIFSIRSSRVRISGVRKLRGLPLHLPNIRIDDMLDMAQEWCSLSLYGGRVTHICEGQRCQHWFR